MDAEAKAKWIAALRGGKYKQAQGALRAAHGFCCLGVLCDVIAPEEWDGGVFRAQEVFLPEPLSNDIGGKDIDLAEMNDSGLSFAEIADWIEENL